MERTKIRILKDIPGFKAGTIFTQFGEDGNWYPEGKDVSFVYLNSLFKSIEHLGDWFEEVKVKPTTFDVYYIRSTGEIIGPNKVSSLGHKLQLRRDYGNLFYSREDAEKAKLLMKSLLTMFDHIKQYDNIKIKFDAK